MVDITALVAGPYLPLGPPLDLISFPADGIPLTKALCIAYINPLPFIFLSASLSPLFKGNIVLTILFSSASCSSLICLAAKAYCVFALVKRSNAVFVNSVTSEYEV